MDLLDLADKLFTGELPIEAHHPFASSGKLAEVQPGVAFVDAFANSAGGRHRRRPRRGRHQRRVPRQAVHETIRTVVGPRLDTAIFTHGHIDHVFGVDLYEEEARTNGWAPPPRDRARGDRRAVRALPDDRRLQRRDQPAAVQGARPALADRVPHARRDVPRHDDDHRRRRDFELFHDRGETDDATWVWTPTRKALFAGDMFIWASPNCGNPQKVQRYARLGGRVPQDGRARARGPAARARPADRRRRPRAQALTEGAELFETLVEQTLA